MNPNIFTEVLAALLNTFLAAAALAALAWVALRFLPRVNAATRYAAWWAVLVAIVAIAAVPFLPERAVESSPSPVVRAAAPPVTTLAPTPLAPAPFVPKPVEVRTGLWVLGVFAAWALVALWRSARIGRSYLVLRGLRRRARLAPPEIASVFDRRRMECGIGRPARLLISNDISAPIAIGFLRPVVMLPETLLAEFSPAELDHVLLHELAHVARYDDWTNLMARAANAVLGIHPVAAFIVSRIDRERENACDDWVVAHTGAARPYAASLTRVFELTHTTKPLLASGMAEGASKLGARVERLLERGRQFSAGVSIEALAVSLAMLIGLVFAAAQSPTWIAFAQESIPMPSASLLENYRGNGNSLLAQLAYYQVPPRPATPPRAPETPRAPEPPEAPEPPRPSVRYEEAESELRAAQARLDELQNRLGQSNDPRSIAEFERALANLERVNARYEFNRPPLLQELIDAGMTNLSVDEIVNMAQNGVSPQYLKALSELGYDKLTRDQIVAMQQNGVSPAFLRGLKDAGITGLTVDQIIMAAQNGVRAQDIKTARTYKRDMSMDDIVKLKQNGAL